MDPPGYTSLDTSWDVIHLVPFFDLGSPAIKIQELERSTELKPDRFDFTKGVLWLFLKTGLITYTRIIPYAFWIYSEILETISSPKHATAVVSASNT